MNRKLTAAALCVLLLAASASGYNSSVEKVTTTGWFACDRCAPGRVEAGEVGPVGRECAQKCLKEGAGMVFVDESRKRVFTVTNPEQVKGMESHYMEIVAGLDAAAGSLQVEKFKVLAEYAPSCGRPRLKE